MVERDLESVYDLLPSTPGDTDSDSSFERLERARAHKADQENECRDGGCPSPQHLGAEGAWAWSHRVYNQIQHGEGETPVFP